MFTGLSTVVASCSFDEGASARMEPSLVRCRMLYKTRTEKAVLRDTQLRVEYTPFATHTSGDFPQQAAVQEPNSLRIKHSFNRGKELYMHPSHAAPASSELQQHTAKGNGPHLHRPIKLQCQHRVQASLSIWAKRNSRDIHITVNSLRKHRWTPLESHQ